MFEKYRFSTHTSLLPIVLFITIGSAALIGVLAANQLILAFGVCIFLLLGIMIFVQFDLIIMFTLMIIYTNAIVNAVKFHDFPYTIGALIVPTLLTSSLVYNVIVRRQKIVVDSVLWLLLGYFVVQTLGTIRLNNASIAMDSLITFFVEGVILYFLLINVIRTPKILRWAIWTLLITGTFLGSLSLYQQITGTFDSNYLGFAQVGSEGFGTGVESIQGEIKQVRSEGPIGEKNYYAQIMLVLVPLGFFQFQSERSKLLRLFAGIGTTIILLGIVLTFSRGIAIGFIILLLIMALMRVIKIHQLVLILVGIFIIFQIFPQYGTRLSSLQSILQITEQDSAGISGTDTATQGRIGEMLAAWQVFLDYPIIGVGPGMFNYYYPHYAERVGLRIHIGPRAAHDLYLGIAADHGLVGMVFFLSIFAVTFQNLMTISKRLQVTQLNISRMAIGLMLALIAYLASGLFLSLAYERYLWLILGLAGSIYHISKTLPSQEMVRSKNLTI